MVLTTGITTPQALISSCMNFTIRCGDAVEILNSMSEQTIDCCVTSPPYFGLRDYGIEGQIGLEETPQQYIAKLVRVFSEVRRVMKDDGTLWVNIGDSYARDRADDLKPKDLIGIPWMLAFALRDGGWYLRSEVIWHKQIFTPESVKDRPTRAHEQIFLLSKSARYYYDADAIKEPLAESSIGRYKYGFGGTKAEALQEGDVKGRSIVGVREMPDGRNKRSVWTINPKPVKEAHVAVFPPEIPEICILAGSREGGMVLDPFVGSGTTGIVASQNRRDCIGIELNPEYVAIAERRFKENKWQLDVFRPPLDPRIELHGPTEALSGYSYLS